MGNWRGGSATDVVPECDFGGQEELEMGTSQNGSIRKERGTCQDDQNPKLQYIKTHSSSVEMEGREKGQLWEVEVFTLEPSISI